MKPLNIICLLIFIIQCKHNFNSCLKQDSLKYISRHAAIIISSNGFFEYEYRIVKSVLTRGGVEVHTYSNKTGISKGHYGDSVVVENLIRDLDVKAYDALIFVGGPGVLELLKKVEVKNLVYEANRANLIIAGICMGAYLLSSTRILYKRKATTSNLYSTHTKMIKNGAFYTGDSVTIDGNFITAFHPANSWEFAFKILTKLGI